MLSDDLAFVIWRVKKFLFPAAGVSAFDSPQPQLVPLLSSKPSCIDR
jgi:hypothetical protein